MNYHKCRAWGQAPQLIQRVLATVLVTIIAVMFPLSVDRMRLIALVDRNATLQALTAKLATASTMTAVETECELTLASGGTLDDS